MPFNNPVVAGEELIRNSIRSENFVSGNESEIGEGEGWAVFRDGTAEFNSITVRGNTQGESAVYDELTANESLRYKGTELQDLLDTSAKGVIAWGEISYGSVLTTASSLGMFEVTATLHTGRMYRISTGNMHIYNQDGEGYARPTIWYTSDGSQPTVSSPIFQSVYRYMDTGGRGARADFVRLERTVILEEQDPAQVFTYRFLLGFQAPSADNVNFNQYFDAPQLIIEDVGPAITNTAVANTGGGGGPALQFKSFDIQPYASRSYAGGGVHLPYDNQYCMQGDAGVDGNRRSWMWWDANDNGGGNGLGTINDMQGLDSLDYFEVFLLYDHWWFSHGTAVIGYHNSNVVTQTEQAGGNYDRIRISNWARDEARWVNLKGTEVETAARNGTLEGLVLGNTGSADKDHYGYAWGATGVNGQQPGLRAGYYK